MLGAVGLGRTGGEKVARYTHRRLVLCLYICLYAEYAVRSYVACMMWRVCVCMRICSVVSTWYCVGNIVDVRRLDASQIYEVGWGWVAW